MEHTIKLHTRENGRFVVKTVATDKYFTVCPYQVGDDDLEEVEVLSVSDLYLMWQELKAGDKSCGENCWKYHFYRHEIKPEHDGRTGKPICSFRVYRGSNADSNIQVSPFLPAISFAMLESV